MAAVNIVIDGIAVAADYMFAIERDSRDLESDYPL
jgi:hypothetical protein